MNRRMIALGACLVVTTMVMTSGAATEEPKTNERTAAPIVARPQIQIAILLDTSGSMRGLIAQAKSELWKIVNQFIGSTRHGQRPELTVALYEYGNDGLASEGGYIRRILPLTDDLDRVSQELFALTTNGGSEYCGQVIDHATKQLQWSGSGNDLKLIFIAGNEPFTQGPKDYRKAVRAAIGRGIVVNTIHCGSYEKGVSGKWKDGALLADGSYSHIDHNRVVVNIVAPQDDELATLGVTLNDTYIAYGSKGAAGASNQVAQDGNAAGMSAQSAVARAVTKANSYYNNDRWDLVDAIKGAHVKLDEVKEEDLPENMRSMTMEQRRAYVAQQKKKRGEIQAKINSLNEARKQFVAAEMKKTSADGPESLDQALIKAIGNQASKKQFKLKK